MKLITPHTNAAEAAERWKETYFVNGSWQYGDDKEKIYHAIVALGSSPDPVDVDRVIGNCSWTACDCNECLSRNKPAIIQLGDEPDYESSTAWICSDCLAKAMALSAEAIA